MNARIIDKPKIVLYGLSFYGDPFSQHDFWTEENEIGQLWNRFMKLYSEKKNEILHIKSEEHMYEIHLENEETHEKGIYEVFVGLELDTIEKVPLEGLIKILPESTYAVFTLKGKKITSDWGQEIFQKWFPGSGYGRSYLYGINLYDKRFKGMDKLEESELDVYIPIIKK